MASRCPRPVRAAVAIFGLALALLTTGAAPALAQNRFHEAYEQGVKAYSSGNLPEAERLLRRSLELEPTQSRSKRFIGMQFGVYIPEYYLGLICARTGRIDEAIRLFDSVEAKKLVSARDPEFGALASQRRALQNALQARAEGEKPPAKGPDPTKAPDPPKVDPPKVDPPKVADTAANTGVAGPPPPPPGEAGRPASVGTGAGGTSPGSTTATAKPVAPSPAEQVAAIIADGERALTQGSYEGVWKAARSAAALSGGADPANRLVARARDQLLREGLQLIAKDELGSAERIAARMDEYARNSAEATRLRSLVTSRRQVVTLERDLLRQLLVGRYEETTRAAQPAVDSGQASPRTLFFAACAQAGLALTTGEADRAATLARALDLGQRARRSGATFARERTYISPEIIALLDARSSR